MGPRWNPFPLRGAVSVRSWVGGADRWFRAVSQAVEPLWVCGLLLLQLACVRRLLHFSGKKFEWTEYLLLGALFPALLLGACFVGRLLGKHVRLLSFLKLGLGVGCLLLAGSFFPAATFKEVGPVWLFFVAVLMVLWVVSPACRPPSDAGAPPNYVLAALLMSAVIWLALSGWTWNPLAYYETSAWKFGILLLAVLLSLCNLFGPMNAARKPTALERCADVAALAVIVWLSFDWQRPCDITTWHHWGALVGPAEMVRQGGWLLWDTPSQYGFLCPLALACFPTDNAFQAFYLLNGSLISLSGILLFLVFRSTRPGWLNYFFSLGLSLTALMTVHLYWFIGPTNGPIRYCWCYALMAVLWAETRRPDRDALPGRRVLVGGCVVWLLGCLWSFESAVNVTVIWAPAFVVLAAQRCLALRRAGRPGPKSLGRPPGGLCSPRRCCCRPAWESGRGTGCGSGTRRTGTPSWNTLWPSRRDSAPPRFLPTGPFGFSCWCSAPSPPSWPLAWRGAPAGRSWRPSPGPWGWCGVRPATLLPEGKTTSSFS